MTKNKILSFIMILLLLPFAIIAGNGDKDKNIKNSGKESINWISIDEAQKLGKKEPRKIIVDVYTDWCGWCKKMDKNTFANEEVVKYVNQHFYAVKLNAESKETVTYNGKELTKQELARAFRVSGYPTVVLIDENFETVFPLPGYREAAEFKSILEQIKDQKPKKN
jgi:thioredoxin-related protein